MLFGTTDEFLKRFDLKDLDQLPNQEEILERLRLIREPEQSESLYYDFKLPDEEEVPEFLQGEELQTISADEVNEDFADEELETIDQLEDEFEDEFEEDDDEEDFA